MEDVIYATKKGEPDWMEDLLAVRSPRVEPAELDSIKAWAEKNGFDRLRIARHGNESAEQVTGMFRQSVNV